MIPDATNLRPYATASNHLATSPESDDNHELYACPCATSITARVKPMRDTNSRPYSIALFPDASIPDPLRQVRLPCDFRSRSPKQRCWCVLFDLCLCSKRSSSDFLIAFYSLLLWIYSSCTLPFYITGIQCHVYTCHYRYSLCWLIQLGFGAFRRGLLDEESDMLVGG